MKRINKKEWVENKCLSIFSFYCYMIEPKIFDDITFISFLNNDSNGRFYQASFNLIAFENGKDALFFELKYSKFINSKPFGRRVSQDG